MLCACAACASVDVRHLYGAHWQYGVHITCSPWILLITSVAASHTSVFVFFCMGCLGGCAFTVRKYTVAVLFLIQPLPKYLRGLTGFYKAWLKLPAACMQLLGWPATLRNVARKSLD
jgi:hypothetical protein